MTRPKLTIAFLLLASGCTTMDVDSEDHDAAHVEYAGYPRLPADSAPPR